MQTTTLQIEQKFNPHTLAPDIVTGVFEGYAALFNHEDLGRDVILPGAFNMSLVSRGPDKVRMLFQHNPAEPIGVWDDIREDAAGLYVRGRLTLDVARAREVLSLMRARAIDGLSIGFNVKAATKDKATGVRRISALDLWEISIVTFPMMPGARIAAVKAGPFPDGTPTPRQFERWLMHDAGLRRSEARALMAHGFKGLKAKRDAGRRTTSRERAQLIARISAATELMRGTLHLN